MRTLLTYQQHFSQLDIPAPQAYGVKVSLVFPPDTETPQLEWENKLKVCRPARSEICVG